MERYYDNRGEIEAYLSARDWEELDLIWWQHHPEPRNRWHIEQALLFALLDDIKSIGGLTEFQSMVDEKRRQDK